MMGRYCQQRQGWHVHWKLAPGQAKRMCTNFIGYDYGTLFEVQSQNPDQGFDLDCIKISFSVLSCYVGGQETNSGWRFK